MRGARTRRLHAVPPGNRGRALPRAKGRVTTGACYPHSNQPLSLPHFCPTAARTCQPFLRSQVGSAETRLSFGLSVCLSVCPPSLFLTLPSFVLACSLPPTQDSGIESRMCLHMGAGIESRVCLHVGGARRGGGGGGGGGGGSRAGHALGVRVTVLQPSYLVNSTCRK